MLSPMKILMIFILLFSLPSLADQLSTEQAHTKVRFTSENEVLQTGTKPNQLGLHFVHDPHWHTYWINPGDSASAPIFTWKVPKGVKVSEPRFPVPKRVTTAHLFSFAYTDDSTIIFDATVDDSLLGQEIELELSAEWVACKVECLPAFFVFKKKFLVGEQFKPTVDAGKFSRAQGVWPTIDAEVKIKETEFRLRFKIADEIFFKDLFPFPNQPVTNGRELRSNQIGDEVELWVERNQNVTWENRDLKFLMIAEKDNGEKFAYILNGKTSGELLWFMALLGFLGGIILNIMPCVFPVLTLKIFSIVNSSGKDLVAIRNGNIFYIAGVLVSFWIIAALLMILQQLGAAVGWGFQLQSPVFVGLLALLFIVVGLSFLDVIKLNLSKFSNLGNSLTQQQGWMGSFFTGVLAVEVASPCTAPFMGAAMGYALAKSPFEVFIIFTGIGVGLASPFIALVLWPESLELLPKPGKWMMWVKKVMAVPMFATAIWLGWVLSLQLSASPQSISGIWQSFSLEKLSDFKDNQKPVFVNFTAAWCISCQVNEQVVFQNQEVLDKIKSSDMKMLKADWTNRDDEIGQVLKSYGRAGVPLYLYFAPGRQQPLILPEILTPTIFLNKVAN